MMRANVASIITGRNKVVAKVMFLHVCVILFTGGSPGRENPPSRENPRPMGPPGQGDPPLGPPWAGRTPLPTGRPPTRSSYPPRADCPPPPDPPGKHTSSIRSTSGRYACYWNAFLYCLDFLIHQVSHSKMCFNTNKSNMTQALRQAPNQSLTVRECTHTEASGSG